MSIEEKKSELKSDLFRYVFTLGKEFGPQSGEKIAQEVQNLIAEVFRELAEISGMSDNCQNGVNFWGLKANAVENLKV